MAKPGNTAPQGAISINGLPWCSIPPHEGDGGCIPSPKKLSALSARIAIDNEILNKTVKVIAAVGAVPLLIIYMEGVMYYSFRGVLDRNT